MDRKLQETVLALHVSRLPASKGQFREILALFPGRDDLASLLRLADRLHDSLVPVRPSDDFRERLHQNLLAAARQELGRPEDTTGRFTITQRVGVAATASALSVAVGLITYVAWSRSRGDAVQPASGPMN